MVLGRPLEYRVLSVTHVAAQVLGALDLCGAMVLPGHGERKREYIDMAQTWCSRPPRKAS